MEGPQNWNKSYLFFNYYEKKMFAEKKQRMCILQFTIFQNKNARVLYRLIVSLFYVKKYLLWGSGR